MAGDEHGRITRGGWWVGTRAGCEQVASHDLWILATVIIGDDASANSADAGTLRVADAEDESRQYSLTRAEARAVALTPRRVLRGVCARPPRAGRRPARRGNRRLRSTRSRGLGLTRTVMSRSRVVRGGSRCVARAAAR